MRASRSRSSTRDATFEIDFLWPQAGYAVEIDGRAYHSTPCRIARDLRRDRILRDAGIEVARFGWQEITATPLLAVATVAARLARTPTPSHPGRVPAACSRRSSSPTAGRSRCASSAPARSSGSRRSRCTPRSTATRCT